MNLVKLHKQYLPFEKLKTGDIIRVVRTIYPEGFETPSSDTRTIPMDVTYIAQDVYVATTCRTLFNSNTGRQCALMKRLGLADCPNRHHLVKIHVVNGYDKITKQTTFDTHLCRYVIADAETGAIYR